MSEDSGLPKGWVLTSLGVALEWGSGGTPQSGNSDYYGGDIPWLVIGDLNDGVVIASQNTITEAGLANSSTRWVDQGSVLLAMYGSIGKLGIAGVPLTTNQAIAFTNPYPIDNRYLFYYLLGQRPALARLGKGATQKNISQTVIKAFPFVVAPLAEQRRIVAAIEEQFTRLDAGVTALRSAQARLKRYRAAVLKAAVEGKLTEEWRAENPATEPASELLERILAERRVGGTRASQAKTSPATTSSAVDRPNLPYGWSWTRVENLLIESMCNGISVKGSDAPPGIPALRLSAMTEGGFRYEERRYIPIPNTVAETLAIRGGDFFVARGNGSLHLVGRGTLAQEPPERIVFPDTMIRLRLAKVDPLLRYVKVAWSSSLVRNQIERTARTTAGIYKISQRDIESFVLPVPPLGEQQQIVAEVERRLSVVDELEATVEVNLKRADRLRQSILREAFAGRLVPQAPMDEPASDLLERIRAERRGAANGGRPTRARRDDRKERRPAQLALLPE